VDDHPIFLDAIGAAMSRKFPDFEVRLMSNIAEARNVLHCGVIPALAVIDVHLPDGDGVELVGEMHAHYGIPVIAFSGQADRFTIDACLKSGASAFVEKTCDTSAFYRAVDAVLSGGRYMSGQTATESSDHFGSGIKLTRRQKDVLEFVLQAQANKAIAGKLGVAEGTVKNHVSDLLTIFDAASRSELALKARQQRYSLHE
jgi:DNA-binding NarL/FixJ family response regulator